jgi:hypothetical protein
MPADFIDAKAFVLNGFMVFPLSWFDSKTLKIRLDCNLTHRLPI